MNFSSINVIHGFKTGLAALAAYIITIVLDLEFGYWAVLSTVIVMQAYVADSVEMCLYRLTGTVCGAVIGVFVLILIPKTYFFIGVALFLTIGICSFLTKYNTRYRMAAITVVIIVITGAHVDNLSFFALSRVFEICIGILCAFAVSVFLFPRRKIDVLKKRLREQSKICAGNCILLVDAFNSKQQNVDDKMMDDIVKSVWENYVILEKIRQHESLIYRKKFKENFSVKISIISRAVEHLRNMARTLNVINEQGHDIIMAKELEKLAEECGSNLIELIRKGSSSDLNKLKDIVSEMDIKLLNLRKEGKIKRFDSKRLVQVFSFYSSLIYFAEDIIAGAEKLN